LYAFLRFFHGVQFRGIENVPKWGPVILASNHPSYFDPILLSVGIERRIRFFALRSILELPGIGWLVRRWGVFPVIRGGDNERSVRKALRALARGQAVGIFPEGRRSSNRRMGEVRPGVGRLAIESGAPVVPVTIFGAFRAWPRTAAIPQPAKIVVVYHAPVWPKRGEEPRAFSERVRRVIVGSQDARRRVA